MEKKMADRSRRKKDTFKNRQKHLEDEYENGRHVCGARDETWKHSDEIP